MNDPHGSIDSRSASTVTRLAESARSYLAAAVGVVGAQLLTPRSLLAPRVRAALWRRGIAAQPKGFYASMTDPRDVARRQRVAPLDLQMDRQRVLADSFAVFAKEYQGLLLERPADFDSHPRFYLRNDAFQNMDALLYWGMIRSYRPKRIVEIGSGFSTLLALDAAAANGVGRVEAVDPYPRGFIRARSDLHLITAPAETVPLDQLLSLEANDIVFVDSSHVVRQGGDVTWFFLEILPRLADGVLVHIHDIHLPFDYPLELLRDRNVYWTEQYLLHAYLAKNVSDEILASSRALAHAFPDVCARVFAAADRFDGASFWLRTGTRSALR